jgi:hypothetical protein
VRESYSVQAQSVTRSESINNESTWPLQSQSEVVDEFPSFQNQIIRKGMDTEKTREQNVESGVMLYRIALVNDYLSSAWTAREADIERRVMCRPNNEIIALVLYLVDWVIIYLAVFSVASCSLWCLSH